MKQARHDFWKFPDYESYSYNGAILMTNISLITLAQKCEVTHICESVAQDIFESAARLGARLRLFLEDRNIRAVLPMFPSHSPHQLLQPYPTSLTFLFLETVVQKSETHE